jgi:hypothetical protein
MIGFDIPHKARRAPGLTLGPRLDYPRPMAEEWVMTQTGAGEPSTVALARPEARQAVVSGPSEPAPQTAAMPPASAGESAAAAPPRPLADAATAGTGEGDDAAGTSAGPRKRRRRRRRKKSGGAGVEGEPLAADAATQPARAPVASAAPSPRDRAGDGGPTKKRRRRRGKPSADRDSESASPAAVVEAATKLEPDTEGAVDTPLTEEEAAEMRRHFRFLREHRKLLRLKLNAQEDLLLNGAREPTHRGVCQHLLSKIDYTTVAGAATRLDPKSRCQFTEGVLRFSTGLPFLLLYLEALKESGHHSATDALSRALRLISFEDVSEGQMKRVLELVVELFDEKQRPKLLLSLLEGKSFRTAFDDAFEKLPSALAELLGPLRAVHSTIIKGETPPANKKELHRGVDLLLLGEAGGLQRRSPAVRERLLQHALWCIPANSKQHSKVLESLLQSFPPLSPRRQELELMRIGGLMHVGEDEAARKRLMDLKQQIPVSAKAGLWLRALNSPRFERIALLGPRKTERKGNASDQPSSKVSKAETLQPAFCLDTQQRLWIRVGEPNEEAAFDAHLQVLKKALLPNVAQAYASNLTRRKGPYVAYPAHSAARSGFRANATLSREQLQAYALDGVMLFAALANLGIRIPDTRPDRFEVDDQGRLWLLDLWGATLDGGGAGVTPCMLTLSAAWCQALISNMPYFSLDEETADILRQPADFPTLLAGLRRVEQTRFAS